MFVLLLIESEMSTLVKESFVMGALDNACTIFLQMLDGWKSYLRYCLIMKGL